MMSTMMRALLSSAVSVGFYVTWAQLPGGRLIPLLFLMLVAGPGALFGALVLWPDLRARGHGRRGQVAIVFSAIAYFATATTVVWGLDHDWPLVLPGVASGAAAVAVAAVQEKLRGQRPSRDVSVAALAAGIVSGALVAALDASGPSRVPALGPLFPGIFVVWQVGVAYALSRSTPPITA